MSRYLLPLSEYLCVSETVQFNTGPRVSYIAIEELPPATYAFHGIPELLVRASVVVHRYIIYFRQLKLQYR